MLETTSTQEAYTAVMSVQETSRQVLETTSETSTQGTTIIKDAEMSTVQEKEMTTQTAEMTTAEKLEATITTLNIEKTTTGSISSTAPASSYIVQLPHLPLPLLFPHSKLTSMPFLS